MRPPPAPTSGDAGRNSHPNLSLQCYAVFHALAASNADVLAGPVYDSLTAEAWVRIYRGLNHNQARSQLQQNRSRFSANVQVFADLLRDLQNERHNADYNPLKIFTAQTAATWLNKADIVIANFLQASLSERVAVAIFTLVRTR